MIDGGSCDLGMVSMAGTIDDEIDGGSCDLGMVSMAGTIDDEIDGKANQLRTMGPGCIGSGINPDPDPGLDPGA
jgi:hypothetical protein